MPSLQQQHAKVWERYIRKECRALRKARKANVDKNWEAPRVPGEPIPREASKPDFSGCMSDGRHVVFEAKATLSETSWSFHDIADHQAAAIEFAADAGAVSFVYILDGSRHKWVVPWDTIAAISDRSSFPFDDPVFRKIEGETWLDTWRRLERKEKI